MVSSAGDGMFLTAFPLLAAILTRDPVLIAGVTIASRLPWLVFSLFTGALADRMDRRKLMIGADLIRFVIVGLLGAAILTDTVNIWMLYASAFLLGSCETLHVNAAQGLIPAIVKQEDLLEANARFASGQIVAAQFIGPPLGVAMFNVSMSLPFIADAATFAGSAALIATVPNEHAVEKPTTKILSDIKEGIRYTIETLSLRRLTEILMVVNFFYFAANSLLVLYNEDLLGGNKITFTALSVGAASGTVISRFFLDKITKKLGKTRTLQVSLWAWAIATSRVGSCMGTNSGNRDASRFRHWFGLVDSAEHHASATDHPNTHARTNECRFSHRDLGNRSVRSTLWWSCSTSVWTSRPIHHFCSSDDRIRNLCETFTQTC